MRTCKFSLPTLSYLILRVVFVWESEVMVDFLHFNDCVPANTVELKVTSLFGEPAPCRASIVDPVPVDVVAAVPKVGQPLADLRLWKLAA